MIVDGGGEGDAEGVTFATGHEGLGGLAFVHHELRSFARTATGVEDKWKQASEEE